MLVDRAEAYTPRGIVDDGRGRIRFGCGEGRDILQVGQIRPGRSLGSRGRQPSPGGKAEVLATVGESATQPRRPVTPPVMYGKRRGG